jgi:hypothetical protein
MSTCKYYIYICKTFNHGGSLYRKAVFWLSINVPFSFYYPVVHVKALAIKIPATVDVLALHETKWTSKIKAHIYGSHLLIKPKFMF